jgi:hypothetical protein
MILVIMRCILNSQLWQYLTKLLFREHGVCGRGPGYVYYSYYTIQYGTSLLVAYSMIICNCEQYVYFANVLP